MDNSGRLVQFFYFCTLEDYIDNDSFSSNAPSIKPGKIIAFIPYRVYSRIGWTIEQMDAIYRVKSTGAIFILYHFSCVMCLQLFLQLSVKTIFPIFHDGQCNACRIETNYVSPFLSYENRILSIEHSVFPFILIHIELSSKSMFRSPSR